MSGYALIRFTGGIHQDLEVIETERGTVAPGAGLILEWARKGCYEELSLLAHILPDRRFDVPTSQGGGQSVG